MTTVRRSVLFTPANVHRFVAGAWKHRPDMVVLDLEDSVAPEEKQAARALVQEAIQLAGRGGAEVAVRVNSDAVTEDCVAAIWPGLCAVVLPKAEYIEEITALDTLLTRLEFERNLPPGSVEIMPMIETAIGVGNAYAIACACRRVTSFGVLGEADLTADLGASFDALQFHDVLAYPRGEVGLAARALGLTVNGRAWTPGKATIADYGDPEALELSMRASWLAGCRSTFCIHPRQVAAANTYLRPSASDVAEAGEALRVHIAANGLRQAYGVHNGHIIDARVVHASQEVIDYAAACDAKDAEIARRHEELEGRETSNTAEEE
jgi:citrate lyase subunit beta/citryl-CoA lyase